MPGHKHVPLRSKTHKPSSLPKTEPRKRCRSALTITSFTVTACSQKDCNEEISAVENRIGRDRKTKYVIVREWGRGDPDLPV